MELLWPGPSWEGQKGGTVAVLGQQQDPHEHHMEQHRTGQEMVGLSARAAVLAHPPGEGAGSQSWLELGWAGQAGSCSRGSQSQGAPRNVGIWNFHSLLVQNSTKAFCKCLLYFDNNSGTKKRTKERKAPSFGSELYLCLMVLNAHH